MGILTHHQKQSATVYLFSVFLAMGAFAFVYQFFVQSPTLAWTLAALVIAGIVAWTVTARRDGRRRARLAVEARAAKDPGEVPVFSTDTVDSLALRIIDANIKAGVEHPSVAIAREKPARALAKGDQSAK